MGFHCDACNEDHEGLPDLALDAPDPYLAIPEAERAERATLTSDRCTVVDEDGTEHFFIRGVIEIPITDAAADEDPDYFAIGAWVSQSQVNFERYREDDDLDTTFGWLVNRIGIYEESTFLLETNVHFREGDMRPAIEIVPSKHPLAIEQHEGITLARAWQIVHRYMH